MSRLSASRILRRLPRENAFYFFTSIGNYTGQYASSLEEFAKKIKEVNIKSLQFHLYRRDFEKWATQTLEDQELAKRIEKLQKIHPSGEKIQEELYHIVNERYENLKDNLRS
jgi:adenylosuccinate lyase